METIEFEHPIARGILTKLRDRRTSADEFRTLTYRLGLMLAVEATRNIITRPLSVETPMEQTFGEEVAEYPVLLPVMRAGLGLLSPFQQLLPESPVAFIAMKRDERTGEAEWLYDSLPNLRGRDMLILDPMLATAGTALGVIDYVLKNGARNVILVSIVAAPEGISRLNKYSDLTFITVSVDRELDSNWYILPGLGDFGDRLYKGE